jgi:hypothetical protein
MAAASWGPQLKLLGVREEKVSGAARQDVRPGGHPGRWPALILTRGVEKIEGELRPYRQARCARVIERCDGWPSSG